VPILAAFEDCVSSNFFCPLLIACSNESRIRRKAETESSLAGINQSAKVGSQLLSKSVTVGIPS
jgi:hypothetical protein